MLEEENNVGKGGQEIEEEITEVCQGEKIIRAEVCSV